MKRLLAIAAIVVVHTSFASAQIAQWTFETSAPASAGPHAAEVGTGLATGSHISGATAYSSPAGNGSVRSFSSNNWAISDYYQFQVSTLGQSAIKIDWDQTSSNTGPRDFGLFYSTNGSTFTQFGSNYIVLANGTPNPAWSSGTGQPAYSFSRDLTGIVALNNQPNVYFRLQDMSAIAANGGAVGTAGTDRVDNVTITPEPASMCLLAIGGMLMARRRR